jgi:glyoxylase-like metal-dependent hydrolase (beta-lactamase superfamily II)
MMQLAEGIFLVGSGTLGFELTHPSDCHVYLVSGDGSAALVDAGSGLDPLAIVGNIKSSGVELDTVTHLFLTHAHADHAGGAAALKEAIPGLTVVASRPVGRIVAQGDATGAGVDRAIEAGVYPATYTYRACPIDIYLDNDERIDVSNVPFQALQTAGHSIGHMCFLARITGKNVLFSGDHVFYDGKIALQNTWDCDVPNYVASLEKLAPLSIDRLLPGHCGVSLSNAHRHIDVALATIRAGRLPASIV